MTDAAEPSAALNRWRFFWIWWVPTFLVFGFVAAWVVMSFDPAGLDSCDGTYRPPTSGEKAMQAGAALAALLASLALALWRLRRGPLVVALVVLAVSGLAWWWVLYGGPPPCEPHPAA